MSKFKGQYAIDAWHNTNYSGGPNTIGGRPRADRYNRTTDPIAAVGSRTAAVSASESARSQGRRPP